MPEPASGEPGGGISLANELEGSDLVVGFATSDSGPNLELKDLGHASVPQHAPGPLQIIGAL